jgi:hypothetical protein
VQNNRGIEGAYEVEGAHEVVEEDLIKVSISDK